MSQEGVSSSGSGKKPRHRTVGRIDGVKRTGIKLDSGAQKTLVNQRFVNKEEYLGQTVNVNVADAHQITLPLEKRHFKFGKDRLTREVAVLSSLDEDVLLGTEELPVFGKLMKETITHNEETDEIQLVQSTRQKADQNT